MEKLGVGLVGSGFVARFHALAWRGVRNAEIAAIYNIREASARGLAALVESLGVGRPRVYTDLGEMLSDGSVDAIWILNPNFARMEAVRVVAEEATQGRADLIGVCCEKPLARNERPPVVHAAAVARVALSGATVIDGSLSVPLSLR